MSAAGMCSEKPLDHCCSLQDAPLMHSTDAAITQI